MCHGVQGLVGFGMVNPMFDRLAVAKKVIGVLLLLRRSHWRCTKQNKRMKPIFL